MSVLEIVLLVPVFVFAIFLGRWKYRRLMELSRLKMKGTAGTNIGDKRDVPPGAE
jgi:hypothetical protein